MKKIFIWITIWGVFCSCEQVVDFQIPFKKKLVIHGFISPGNSILNDSIIVSVGTNTPVVGEQKIDGIGNAKVTLTGSTQKIDLLLLPRNLIDYHNQVFRYGISRKEFSINAGENYTLSVKNSEGLQTESSCKIPQKIVPENEIEISILEKSKDKIRCRVDWKDISNERNFYIGSILLALVGKDGQHFLNNYVYTNDTEAVKNMQSTNELTFTNFGFDYNPEQSSIYVAVANIEKNYYDWGITQIYQRRQNESNLFPEPVFLNSTFSNNLGIFTGYNATYIVKSL